MATIGFLRYNGLPQVIDKNFEIVKEAISGSFNQPYSLMNPTITLSGQVDDTIGGNLTNMFFSNNVNYLVVANDGKGADGGYVSAKYYYITDYEFTRQNYLQLKLHLDVLTTYRREINRLDVMLERSEESEEDDVHDSLLPVSSNFDIERIDLPSKFNESETTGTYVLVTSQNGYSIAD